MKNTLNGLPDEYSRVPPFVTHYFVSRLEDPGLAHLAIDTPRLRWKITTIGINKYGILLLWVPT